MVGILFALALVGIFAYGVNSKDKKAPLRCVVYLILVIVTVLLIGLLRPDLLPYIPS